MTPFRLGSCHMHSGQITVEYLVMLMLVVGFFAVPGDGQPSLLMLFIHAVGTAFARFLSALSLPV